jgi:hypothetical protein
MSAGRQVPGVVRKIVRKRPTSVGVLARGKDYSVRDLGGTMAGYTDMLAKELGVCLDAEEGHTRWVHLHELSHIQHDRWTPGRVRDEIRKRFGREVQLESVLGAMDVRVNELVTRKVADAHEGFTMPKDAQWNRTVWGYAASHASPPGTAKACGQDLAPDVRAAVDAQLAKVKRLRTDQLTVRRVVMPMALLLDELSEHAPGGAKGGTRVSANPGKSSGADKAEADATGAEAKGEGDEDVLGEGGDVAAPSVGVGCEHAKAFRNRTEAERRNRNPLEWWMPEVVEPPLDVVRVSGNACVTAAETGTRLRWHHAHRIVTDGVVFRRAKRRPGTLQRGTVLIDASGSMDWSNEDLAEIVTLLPHATVAIYSCAGSSAWIVVVAREGRVVRDINDYGLVPRGGGNGCDGPALLWLSRMPGPRLWVSDAEVVGRYGQHASLTEECKVIMEAAGIVQLVKVGVENRATAVMTLAGWGNGRIDNASLPTLLRDVQRGTVQR